MMKKPQPCLSPGAVAAGPKPRLPDALLDRYEPVREIGNGGLCRVVLATDRQSGGRVALKLLKPDIRDYEGAMMLMAAEVEALSLVRRPGIVSLLSHSLADTPHLALEYVEGNQLGLRPLMGRENREVLRLFAEISGILSSIHAKGIVHRDMKLANVLLRDGLNPVLIDFDYAKVPGMRDFAAVRRRVVGTPEYMAPEQTYPWASVDYRADIYSFGVMMYILVSGALPFRMPEDFEREDMMECHRIAPVIPLAEVRPSLAPLWPIIGRAMEKDPAARFQSAEDMKRALLSLT